MASCAADALPTRDLGDTSSSLDNEGEGASAGERRPLLDEGGIDPFIIGRWVGQAEDLFASAGPDGQRPTYAFPSGSGDIVLELEIHDMAPRGEVVFGSGVPPEPLPGVAFPPDFKYSHAEAAGTTDDSAALLPPIEGFVYPLSERIQRLSGSTGVAAGSLALSYTQNEPFRDWCPLQPSIPQVGFGFNCIGSVQGFSGGDDTVEDPCLITRDDGTREPVDCDFAALCLPGNNIGVCECTENECRANEERVNHLWLTREGDELIGNFVGSVFDHGTPGRFLPIGNIRFRRD